MMTLPWSYEGVIGRFWDFERWTAVGRARTARGPGEVGDGGSPRVLFGLKSSGDEG